MYHELLVALSGTPGAIFKVNKDNELEVTKNLPFVHPSEIELLDKICKLGGFYRCFQKFVEEYSVDLSPVHKILKKKDVDSKPLNGQYLHAFCAGLSSVLQPYQDSLVQIEEQVMKDPYTSLSFVHQGLEDYFFIFPVLSNIINTIETKKIHGCQILELLQETANCGIPGVRRTVERILHHCHGVLFKQLSAWMLHGILLDEYREFFITDRSMDESIDNRKRIESDDVDGAVLSSNTILRGVTGRDLVEELQLDDNPFGASVEASRIMIAPSMLPSYIPSRVAEKIMFIGESVQMLKDSQTLKMYHSNSKISNILQGREMEFLQTLHKLQIKQHLSIPALEVEVDKIKACVAVQLWKLVVEDAHLIKHLKLLKEMYLLGRGELYLTLIDHLHVTMKAPSSSIINYDINAAFKQSLAKILTYSEDYEDLFELKIDTTPSSSSSSSSSVEDGAVDSPYKSTWDRLKIDYNPPWPLHLLFTPLIMEKYNTLFSFLLKVRRTQISLQSVWGLLMSNKRSAKTNKVSAPKWVLRRRMAFFVDNLQYYLQVDVLESQFTALLENIKKTQDFETINKSLDFFLIQMLMQSFVSMKKVYGTLHNILHNCMTFCEVMTSGGSHWDETCDGRVQEISREFEKQTSLLFTILSSVKLHQTSPHLAQLLLRIDFNKFFTKTADSSMKLST